MIAEPDITYGDDIPWYGFDKLSPPTTPGIENRRQSVYMTFCRGVERTPLTKRLSVEWVPKQSARSPSHSSPAFLPRREVPHPPGCRLTLLCLPRRLWRNHYLPMRGLRQPPTLLAKVLDAERPDLVFTGDQLNGQGTSWDVKSVLAKFAKVVTQRKIPWTSVFGNHDAEGGEAKRDRVRYMQGLPDSLV